ncbi:MAG: DNA polymerase III subunit gamma/tau [Candidatus Firestonebacteria bacterium]
MSYLVFARKYRPQTFDEVVGQEHVAKTLKNAIESGRIAHAYLFSGPRGVGKTSMARILSKAINCEKGPTPSPCNKCNSCMEITGDISPDVMEIDAASNTGVDDVRDLREKLRFLPVKNKYKIYIIDEVHRLSGNAFDALLKVLEEPPEHVHFVFATTEISKVPLTVASRCQKFNFRKLTVSEISAHLSFILKKENIEIDDKILNLIARNSDGSLRDAESILDQVISYANGEIKIEEVERLLELVDTKLLSTFANCLIDKKTEEILNLINEIFKSGHDILLFCKYLVEFFRNLLIIKIAKKPEELIEIVDIDDINNLKEFSDKLSESSLINIIKILTTLMEDLKYSSYPRVLLEVAAVKITRMADIIDVNLIISKLENLEKEFKKEVTSKEIDSVEQGETSSNDNIKINDIEEIDLLNDGDENENLDKIKKNWEIFIERVRERKKTAYGCLASAVPSGFKNNKLYIDVKDDYSKKSIEIELNQMAIKEAFKEMFKKSIDIIINKTENNSIGEKPPQTAVKYVETKEVHIEPIVKVANQIFEGRILKKGEYGKF